MLNGKPVRHGSQLSQFKSSSDSLENLKKKHRDWKLIMPLIAPAIENQKKYKDAKKPKGEFVAEWKNLQT